MGRAGSCVLGVSFLTLWAQTRGALSAQKVVKSSKWGKAERGSEIMYKSVPGVDDLLAAVTSGKADMALLVSCSGWVSHAHSLIAQPIHRSIDQRRKLSNHST